MDIILSNLKRIIAESGLKYKSVAAIAGINESRFYRIIQGATELSCADLAAVCTALKITPNDAYGIKQSA